MSEQGDLAAARKTGEDVAATLAARLAVVERERDEARARVVEQGRVIEAVERDLAAAERNLNLHKIATNRRAKPVVYTPVEAARIFQCGVPTVVKMLRNRSLRGVKVGGRWRVPVAAVDEFVSRQAAQGLSFGAEPEVDSVAKLDSILARASE